MLFSLVVLICVILICELCYLVTFVLLVWVLDEFVLVICVCYLFLFVVALGVVFSD